MSLVNVYCWVKPHLPLTAMDLFYLAILWLFSLILFVSAVRGTTIPTGTRSTYSRDALLQLNCARLNHITVVTLPQVIQKDFNHDPKSEKSGTTKKRRKRRKQGGVELRLKKQQLTRIPLPSVVMGNVQSLRNKMDEFQGNIF